MFSNVLVGVDGRSNGQAATALGSRITKPDGRLTLVEVRGRPSTLGPDPEPLTSDRFVRIMQRIKVESSFAVKVESSFAVAGPAGATGVRWRSPRASTHCDGR